MWSHHIEVALPEARGRVIWNFVKRANVLLAAFVGR